MDVARTRPGNPEVHSITGAHTPRSDDLEQRMGRYLVSMLIRTICVVLVLVVDGPLRWVFAVGAIVLPYVAVILANNSGQRRQVPTAVLGDHRRPPRQIAARPSPERMDGDLGAHRYEAPTDGTGRPPAA